MSDISAETREVEREFNLNDRFHAVQTLVHALDYVRLSDHKMLDRVNANEIMADGIKNAIDGRATGFEHRTVRHTYRNARDGAKLPAVRDRRCERCGAVDAPYFTHCYDHAPPRLEARPLQSTATESAKGEKA